MSRLLEVRDLRTSFFTDAGEVRAVNGISFTALNETPGMGMRAAEPAFKDQFNNKAVTSFILKKSGGSVADNEIDSISGASTTSGAVVNAVNAGLDFFHTVVKGDV